MEPVSPASSARARREKLIVILGPTASGKTALSVELAKALQTEILSGDSMLVYRGFDIGAAKPTEAERQGVAHHLIDICNPDEPYSVPLFQQQAKAIIHRLNDVEDKGVAVPEDMTMTAQEIREQVRFQEQYFETEIEMLK